MIAIDIPMPKDCIDCPLYNHEFGRCNITNRALWYYDEPGSNIKSYDPFKERDIECPLEDLSEEDKKNDN